MVETFQVRWVDSAVVLSWVHHASDTTRWRLGVFETWFQFVSCWRPYFWTAFSIFHWFTRLVDNFIIKQVYRMSDTFIIFDLHILHFLLITVARHPTDNTGGSSFRFGGCTTGWNNLEICFSVIVENFSQWTEWLGHLGFYWLICPLRFHLLQCLLYLHHFLNKRNILKAKLIIELNQQSLLKELN